MQPIEPVFSRRFLIGSALGATVLVASGVADAGSGYQLNRGDSFQTHQVNIPAGGAGRSARQLTFRVQGTGMPGIVVVHVLDQSGHELTHVRGRVRGACPGSPTHATFAQLHYSQSSEVRATAMNRAAHVEIICGGGSTIQFEIPN